VGVSGKDGLKTASNEWKHRARNLAAIPPIGTRTSIPKHTSSVQFVEVADEPASFRGFSGGADDPARDAGRP